MSRLILLTVVVFLFSSCNQQKQESKQVYTEDKELNDAISKAEESEIIETKMFLGFEFGMTEKEVDGFLSQLIKEEKIYVNNNNEFQFDFFFNGMDIYLNFVPEFYNGKLYKMIYPAKTWAGSSNIHVFLMKAFKDTKQGFETHINNDLMGDTYYTNIKDNLIITFRDSRMIYENAPISRIVKQKENQMNIEKSNKSNSEF